MHIFIKQIIFGISAGLSVGVFCISSCLPVFLPVLLSEKRNVKKSFWAVLEFSAGRLVGYLLFGLLFGWLGQVIRSGWIHTIASLGNLWMGVVLILYGLGQIDKKICSLLPHSQVRWPLVLGLLTGVNVCPPFIASLTHVFNLRSAISSGIYFVSFFVGTSVYLIPAAFFGIFTKLPWLVKLARFSSVLVGIYFVLKNFIVFIT